MEETPKIIYCGEEGCSYKSQHNHNVLRHRRRVHKTDRVTELPDTDAEEQSPPSPPSVISDTVAEEEEDEMTYDDLENMIDDKIGTLLKSQGLGKVNPKNLRQSAVKTFFNGSTGHLIAGIALGFIISNNLPMILGAAKNGLVASSVKSVVPPQMTPEEIQRRIMAQQLLVNQLKAQLPSESSPPPSSQSASPPSSTSPPTLSSS